jgi:hypothetical protein
MAIAAFRIEVQPYIRAGRQEFGQMITRCLRTGLGRARSVTQFRCIDADQADVTVVLQDDGVAIDDSGHCRAAVELQWRTGPGRRSRDREPEESDEELKQAARAPPCRRGRRGTR